MTTIPRQSQHLLVTQAGDEIVLHDPRSETVHVLNPTAALVWNLCDGRHTLEDAEQAIRARFAVPSDRDVLADVRDLLAALTERGLLETEEALR
ncbi:MAG: PqqD family protein [Anaerolineae bacterium]|nr:PqqD family protein [Anaerolineae bacterium]